MRDAGLQAALQAAGGTSALARKLGVAQPSISGWTRVPAERVVAVEAATGILVMCCGPISTRPRMANPLRVTLDPIDEARAQLYLLFANLLLRVPDERILIDLRQIGGDDSALGEALRALAAAADVTRAEDIAREHFTLFIGVGRGELLPFASYYQTGFLYERPLVRVRSDMRRLGLERGEEFQEPEDHLGFLMETMSGLITRRIPCEAREEKAYFERHLKPWVERFFADLEKMDQQPFYRAVGRLGSVFMAIEREAFALAGEETPDAA